jgi:biotin transport system substrate-specific component
MVNQVENKKFTKRGNPMSSSSVRNLCQIALFAAILAVLSQISIPMPSGVPATLQTLAIGLCASCLGWKRGSISVLVYLALGAVGVPVFAQFSGGIAKFVGVTGGFLWGFLPMTLLCGAGAALQESMENKKLGNVLCVVLQAAGLLVCHFCGVLQFSMLAGRGFWTSALQVSVPYLLKDSISLVIAFVAAKALIKVLEKTHISLHPSSRIGKQEA